MAAAAQASTNSNGSNDIFLQHETLSNFAHFMPLPIRVSALISLGILAWASNLHILSAMGIDTSAVLDVRVTHNANDAVMPSGVGGGASNSHTHSSASNHVSTNANDMLSTATHLHPSKLYPPVYSLAALYFGWTALGWAVYSAFHSYSTTQQSADVLSLEVFIPAAFALLGVIFFLLPTERFHRRERQTILRSLKRIVFGTLFSPVPFSDVIFADFLTSYAKVMGDVWISAGLLVGTDTRNTFGGTWGVPLLTSLPYLWRFRQCLAEVCLAPAWSQPSVSSPTHAYPMSTTPRDARLRSALNALKYASAFPVILLSAMQGQSDIFDETPQELADVGVWFGPKSLFRLWMLAVFVNSFYSFWWDVTNDWGLGLLIPSAWRTPPPFIATHLRRFSAHPFASSNHGHIDLDSFISSKMPRKASSSSSNNNASAHSRARSLAASANGHYPADTLNTPRGRSVSGSLTPDQIPYEDQEETRGSSGSPVVASSQLSASANGHTQPSRHASAPPPKLNFASYHSAAPFLRPHILLPDPLIYYTVIGLDLLLRLTWSLKLSSHLHTIHEIEQGVFLMEALEVMRRWIWVFVRIEWQAVSRTANGGQPLTPSVVGPHHQANSYLLPLNSLHSSVSATNRNASENEEKPKHGLGLGLGLGIS